MKDNEQTIKCSVHDCKHCDCDDNKCKLDKIKVCNCSGDGGKETTMCDSYKEKFRCLQFYKNCLLGLLHFF